MKVANKEKSNAFTSKGSRRLSKLGNEICYAPNLEFQRSQVLDLEDRHKQIRMQWPIVG